MRLSIVALGMAACAAIDGCGGNFTVAADAAAIRLEEARAVGAAELAPFEYYDAKQHLEQAAIEAAKTKYGDATRLAQQAESIAAAAIELTAVAQPVRP